MIMDLIHPAPAHLSHSQIGALLPGRDNSCGLRWSFKYRLKMEEQPSLAMELGSALDDGLNCLLRPALVGRPVDLEAGIAAMTERMHRIPEELADADQWKAEAKALQQAIMGFYAVHGDWHGQDVQCKLEVVVPGISVPLLGYLDRIDADGTVVDHKLSRSQHTKDGVLDPVWVSEKKPQLALYLAMLAIAEGVEVGSRTKAALEVCYVTARLKTPQWTYQALEIPAEEQEQALQDARTAWFVRESGRFSASPGRQCQWCPYTRECRTVQAMLAPDISQVASLLGAE